jgi:hypothetical protein
VSVEIVWAVLGILVVLVVLAVLVQRRRRSGGVVATRDRGSDRGRRS